MITTESAPRLLPPSQQMWSSAGRWPNSNRRIQTGNWLRTITREDGGLEWHYPQVKGVHSVALPLGKPFPPPPPSYSIESTNRLIVVLSERLRVAEEELIEARADLTTTDMARKTAEELATTSAALVATESAARLALSEELGQEQRDRAHFADVQQEQLKQAEAAASQIAQKLEATTGFGTKVEGVWFRRWRAECWRRLKAHQQRALRQSLQRRQELQKVRAAEGDATQRGRELQAEVDALRLRCDELLTDLQQSEVVCREQEEALRLQRGFAELRLVQAARRVHGQSSDQEREAQQRLERLVREQATGHEAMIQRMQEASEAEREKQERLLRQQIGAEQRREITREMDKRNAALIKENAEKVEAARREATEQVSEEFNELIDKQQREIELLKVERAAAMRKADMYKARVDEKKK